VSLESSGGPGRRPRRRSREEVSQALIDAAATLFAERPSGRVTVREIADRAGVNAGLVHRYFGRKERLMRAAMEQSQRAIAVRMDEVDDVRRDIDIIFRELLGRKEFIAVLARASLDGVLPEFPAGYPTMTALLQRIEAARGATTPGGPDAPPSAHDPRVVVACLGALTLGYGVFERFVRRGTGLDTVPDDQVEAAILDVLRAIIAGAFEGPHVGDADE
jgi:AcrR family transcriptional regulator